MEAYKSSWKVLEASRQFLKLHHSYTVVPRDSDPSSEENRDNFPTVERREGRPPRTSWSEQRNGEENER